MSEIKYKTVSSYKESDILRLYENVGWIAYTKDIKKLLRAISNSLYIITAWDKDKLVGLIRIIGDGKKYEAVRQKVVLTDDTERTKAFYKSNGFNIASELKLVSYVQIENN